MTRKRTIYLTTLLYLLLITLLSLINLSPQSNSVDVVHFDKVVHFCFYFGLNTLLLLTKEVSVGGRRFCSRFMLTMFVIAYSAGIEVVQGLVGRECDLLDIVANSLGAITSLLLFKLLRLIVLNKVIS